MPNLILDQGRGLWNQEVKLVRYGFGWDRGQNRGGRERNVNLSERDSHSGWNLFRDQGSVLLRHGGFGKPQTGRPDESIQCSPGMVHRELHL